MVKYNFAAYIAAAATAVLLQGENAHAYGMNAPSIFHTRTHKKELCRISWIAKQRNRNSKSSNHQNQ